LQYSKAEPYNYDEILNNWNKSLRFYY